MNIGETIKNIFMGNKKIFAFWLLNEPSNSRKARYFLFKTIIESQNFRKNT